VVEDELVEDVESVESVLDDVEVLVVVDVDVELVVNCCPTFQK
jgi:hypothetical protein